MVDLVPRVPRANETSIWSDKVYAAYTSAVSSGIDVGKGAGTENKTGVGSRSGAFESDSDKIWNGSDDVTGPGLESDAFERQ